MFLELTEILRCPAPHDESYVISAPVTMDDRDIVRGGIACPVCRAEYPIIDRIAWLGPPGEKVAGADPSAPPSALTAEAAQAFLDLQGAGGFVVTFGSAGRLGPALAALLPGVGIAGVNVPEGVEASGDFSLLWSPRANPIRGHTVRGAIVGGDVAGAPWLDAAAAAVLPGLRIIVERQDAAPAGAAAILRGAGVFVGERRAR